MSENKTYQEPSKITEQRNHVLRELQKASESHSGILQEVLLKVYRVVEKTTPNSCSDLKLNRETELIIKQYLNDREQGKVSSEIPPAIPLAIEFMQNNVKVLKEADRLEKEGKPLVVKEVAMQSSVCIVHFNDSKLEPWSPAPSRQVFLGEHYSTTMTKSPTIKTPGWINPALGHINV